MKIGKGMVAGLGIASLLVALPAGAQSNSSAGSSGPSSGSATDKPGSTGSSGSMGTSGSTTSGGTASSGSLSQNQITGKVEKFDRTKNELSLRLKVSDSTQVMKDGQRASLSDIKEGDQVRASFSGSGDTLQVQRIDVMSSGSGSLGAPSGSSPGSSGTTPGSSGSGSSPGSSGRGY